MLSGLTIAAVAMAKPACAIASPTPTPSEQWLRLAIQVHGADLTMRVYPDAAALVDP